MATAGVPEHIALHHLNPGGNPVQPVIVRPLTTETFSDFLDLFDDPATFSHRPEWAGCYCFYYYFSGARTEWEHRSPDANRTAIAQAVQDGVARGILAYVGGRPVGWCNAAPRRSFPLLSQLPWLITSDSGDVGAIVCFIVHPHYRRCGVATALLNAACALLAELGMRWAEGYPAVAPQSDAEAYHGTLNMFRRAGFTVVAEAGRYAVVRRSLP
jgi:GNAT superfamily N-acetyltransferase